MPYLSKFAHKEHTQNKKYLYQLLEQLTMNTGVPCIWPCGHGGGSGGGGSGWRRQWLRWWGIVLWWGAAPISRGHRAVYLWNPLTWNHITTINLQYGKIGWYSKILKDDNSTHNIDSFAKLLQWEKSYKIKGNVFNSPVQHDKHEVF